jgi:hypothetical protein
VPAVSDVERVRTLVQGQLQRTLNRPISIANIRPIQGENGETIGYSIWLSREGSTTF